MTPGTGFLTRLARSKRAATLPMMAAAVIPLVGMLGGGLDLSRLYIVKTRLQHACDAGALAGRRTMGGGIWTQSSNLPQRTAVEFFDSNIEGNAFGATVSRPTYTESAGRVTGNATATVPMTLMRVFGYQQMTLTATCDAEMRLPNTDVMFVLDTTGSMDGTLPGDSRTKISALRFAVKCFYEEVARLNTDADCTPGTPGPTGGTGTGTQIRFGFVPYATNVNVGHLLNTSWVVNNRAYQSRTQVTIWGVLTGNFDDPSNKGSWSSWGGDITNYGPASEQACRNSILPAIVPSARSSSFGNGKNEGNGGLAGNGTFEADQAWRETERQFVSYRSSDKRCRHRERTRDFNRTLEFQRVNEGTANAVAFSAWNYQQVDVDVSGYKNGTGWRNSITLPIGNNYTNANVTWDGCIEERDTVRASTYYPIPAGAIDLDIDRLPTSDASRWAPAPATITYVRRENYSNSSAYRRTPITTFTNYSRGGYSCPTAARKLQVWPSTNPAEDLEDYVDDLNTGGNTYHDIGLLWGARLMSPTGLFASENALTPSGGEIERHMIFMTDGEACTGIDNYQAYGIAWWDRRQTDDSVAPTDSNNNGVCDPTRGTLTAQVNARFPALCEAVKNKNITLWVIYFGTTDPTTTARMTNCATPGRFYPANNSAQLVAAFRSIASQISQLRLTS